MRGISEERLNELKDNDCYSGIEQSVIYELLSDECKEINPWIPIDEFLKSGFVGKCFIFAENLVLETDFDSNGFWYVFKYVDNNKITHVMPIHKPDAPKE